MAEFSLAGALSSIAPLGTWWAAFPKESWPDNETALQYVKQHWQEPWGDRRQEIVFIGSGIDWPTLTAQLDACLVPEAEATDLESLPDYHDPFPAWRRSSEQAA